MIRKPFIGREAHLERPTNVSRELEQQIAHYPLPRDYSFGRRIFVHHRPAKLKKLPAKIHTLDQMFRLEKSTSVERKGGVLLTGSYIKQNATHNGRIADGMG